MTLPVRAFLLAASVLAALPARAQTAEAWLREALNPPTPEPPGPSDAVYPPQQIGLTFSHKVHVDEDVDCTECHDAVDHSRLAADRNIPGHTQCEDCHDIDAAARGEKTDPASNCEVCHAGVHRKGDPVAPDVFPANNLRFPHDVHLARKIACTTCHQGIEKAKLGTRANLTRMVQCLDCHDGTKAPDRCSTCHLTEPDGLLQTRFDTGMLEPTGQIADDDHGRDFLHRHAHLAQSDLAACSSCHRQAECESCHANSSKALRVHPPDWLASHGLSARTDELSCRSCHRAQSFCVACHQQRGVAMDSPLRAASLPLGRTTFHPPGWSSLTRNGPNHHSFYAQQNIEACASCHQEADCMQCHATTGAIAQINPHPIGWKESGAACRAFHQAPIACAKCHGGGANLTSVAQLLVGCP